MPTTTFANLPDGFNLMALFDQAFAQCLSLNPPNTVSGSGPFAIASNEYGDILVNCTNPVTINLPTAASRTPTFSGIPGVALGGQPVRIVDVSGTASTNNITIVPAGAETIMGLASIKIIANWGSFTLFPLPTGLSTTGWYTG